MSHIYIFARRVFHQLGGDVLGAASVFFGNYSVALPVSVIYVRVGCRGGSVRDPGCSHQAYEHRQWEKLKLNNVFYKN